MELEQLLNSYDYKAKDYFLKVVSFPTQADVEEKPQSLAKFFKCANWIAEELKSAGVKKVEITKQGYVYGTIPSNIKENATLPSSHSFGRKTHTIALMAHYDTALENPDSPVIAMHHKYTSGNIKLPHNNVMIKSTELKGKKGQTVITSDGQAQLGGDDKAGVATVMDVARFLVKNPQIKHGDIKLVFNNNEEVGSGIKYLDFKKLGADYAYCLDNGEVGRLFVENFNAEACDIEITGVTVHPGYAKKQMINALFLVNELVTTLRKQFKAPEDSENRQPYLGLSGIEGNWTKVKAHYILRGFDKKEVVKMQKAIQTEIKKLKKKYPKAKFEVNWDKTHRYQNAGEILKKNPLITEMAKKAYRAVGVKVIPDLTRGGFDGVNMSFKGLPTTNLFNGGMNFHGLNEWVTVEELELTVRMLAHLVELWGKR